MKLVVIEMENKEKQKTKKTDVVKPYTIRILPNNECFLQSWAHCFLDSKADQVIKFSEVDKYFESLRKDIKEGKRQVPEILKIKLDAHGWSDGNIFMGNMEASRYANMYYLLGRHIGELLKMGAKRVYIKTSPCYGGCYVDASGEKKVSFKL